MDVDQDERVMPNAGDTEGNAAGVIVPRGDGEASSVKEREGLAALPVAPVNGAGQDAALMDEVEDVKEHANGAAKDEEEDEEAGDDDDLFGCVWLLCPPSRSGKLMEIELQLTATRVKTKRPKRQRLRVLNQTLDMLLLKTTATSLKQSLNGGGDSNMKKRMLRQLKRKYSMQKCACQTFLWHRSHKR